MFGFCFLLNFTKSILNSKIEIEPLESLSGHKGSIFALERGIDSNEFFSGDGNGMLVKWNLKDTHSAQLIAQIPSNIFCIKLIEDLNILFVGGLQGLLYIIDLNKNQLIQEPLDFKKSIYNFELWNNQLLFVDGNGLLNVLNIGNFKLERQIKISDKNLRSIRHNSAASEFIVGSSDGNIYILDEDFKIKQIIKHHSRSVFCTEIIDKNHFIAGSMDAHISVWEKGKELWDSKENIPAHMMTVNSIALNHNDRLIATASRDKSIKIWSAQDLKLLKVIEAAKYGVHTHSVNKIIWKQDKNVLISASDDRKIMLWQVEEVY